MKEGWKEVLSLNHYLCCKGTTIIPIEPACNFYLDVPSQKQQNPMSEKTNCAGFVCATYSCLSKK